MDPIAIDLIAIDGPAGVGKSTVAQRLAERLGYYFLSSGMIYRAMAADLLGHGWAEVPESARATELPARIAGLVLRVDGRGRVWVNGRDVTDALRSEAVSHTASVISTHPAVRDRSNQVQRATVADLGAQRAYPGVILEGRDIGTVVFPDAPHKFFLTAEEGIRAQRRFAEQQAAHPELSYEDVRRAMQERDARDAGRAVAPLVAAPDAIVVDTSGLSLEQVLDRILKAVKPE